MSWKCIIFVENKESFVLILMQLFSLSRLIVTVVPKKIKILKNKSIESTKQALAKSNIFKHLFYIK